MPINQVADTTTNETRIIAATWEHSDSEQSPPLPMVEWLRANMDGSFSVNWQRAEFLSTLPDNQDASMMNTIMQARLVVAARGNFRVCSFEAADRIAMQAGLQVKVQ